MPVSVRLGPVLEERLKQEARRMGITQSEFIKDALERVLGLKNPAQLLAQTRSGQPTGRTNASESTSAALKARLHAKYAD
jgi:Arc/MetJ-type ribon-helix-helix transcriptional regulator